MKDLTIKYRPKVWDDIVGQEALVKVLKREIEEDAIGHAYLLTGPRGTGKTSTARVFANAIDAVVIEMDAASNNGVDNIRALREDVQFLPMDGKKYKIYVLDEIHMLTTAGANAFLKTLEEPPSHVIFVMATTDPQKLPITILSRCQRFDLRRITNEEIVERLEYVAGEEGLNVDQESLNYIAKNVDGGMRDAIRLLQKCSSIDDTITKDTVIEALGTVDTIHLEEIVAGLLNKNAAIVLEKFHQLIDIGVDVRIFLNNLIEYLVDTGAQKIITGDSAVVEIQIANELLGLIYQTRNLTMLKISTDLKFVHICGFQNKAAASLLNMGDVGTEGVSQSELTEQFNNIVSRLDAFEERLKALALSVRR